MKKIREAGPPDQRSESLCLHRRGHRRLSRRRRERVPCGRREGHGRLGARTMPRRPALADATVRWIVDDCAKFVEREIRRGRTSMTPSSWIRRPTAAGRGGEVWKLEDNLWDVCCRSAPASSRTTRCFVLINSYTTGLAAFGALVYHRQHLYQRPRRGGSSRAEELGLARHAERTRAPLRGELPLGGLNGRFRHHISITYAFTLSRTPGATRSPASASRSRRAASLPCSDTTVPASPRLQSS